MRRVTAVFLAAACAAEAPVTVEDMVGAAAKGDQELVKLALSSGIHVDATDTKGMTALQSAAGQGQAAVVRTLIRAGANVDIQFNTAWSALAFAAEHANDDEGPGGLESVTALIDAGANPMLEDWNHYNALMRADPGTPHHAVIEARVRQISEVATPCVLATGEKCSDKELEFAEKWKSKSAEEVDAQVTRMSTLLNTTTASSIKPELRKWFRQRLNVLSQIKGTLATGHDEL